MTVLGMITPVRHLTEKQAATALRRGAAIEQLLPATLDEGTVRWLSLIASDDGLTLRRHEVLDDGNDDFRDVYEFRPVNENEDAGEGVPLDSFTDAPAAIEAATRNGARTTRWVKRGVNQDEYAYLRSAGEARIAAAPGDSGSCLRHG